MKHTVPDALDGERLDKAIIALAEGASRARVKKAIEAGAIRVNGRRIAKGGLVKAGDEIEIVVSISSAEETGCLPDPAAPLTIVFESPDVLVADKPVGQASAPIREGELGTLANALLARYPELAGIGYSPREPGIVHRIDADTSGLVVVARTAEAFQILRDGLLAELLAKSYYLICKEDGLPDEGTIEYPIANHPKDSKRVYPCIHPRDVIRYSPRPAMTDYTVEKRVGPWALVRAEAPRAIRHQLRAHFAALGHPLAGDTLYGGETVEGLTRHALHASRVTFEGKSIDFDVHSPLPADMASIV